MANPESLILVIAISVFLVLYFSESPRTSERKAYNKILILCETYNFAFQKSDELLEIVFRDADDKLNYICHVFPSLISVMLNKADLEINTSKVEEPNTIYKLDSISALNAIEFCIRNKLIEKRS